MIIAANLSGKAINISKTTAPHAVSYPFTSLFNISHGHAVSLFFEKFLKFNYENLDKSVVSFDLKKRFNLIFNLFEVSDLKNCNLKISSIKKQAKLDNNIQFLKIDSHNNMKEILAGINNTRLNNNPIKLQIKDIPNIILDKK